MGTSGIRDEPMGTADSDNRSNTVPERSSWHDFVVVALVVGAVGIVVALLMANSYYSGVLEGLSMLPVSEVHHDE
jgi:hypothetical protein